MGVLQNSIDCVKKVLESGLSQARNVLVLPSTYSGDLFNLVTALQEAWLVLLVSPAKVLVSRSGRDRDCSAAVPWRILQPAVQPWPLAWARFCREPGHGLWTREKLKSVSVTWREEGEKGPARGLRQPGSAGSSQQEESVAGMCRCKAEITQLLVLPLAARVCVQAELSWRGALHNAMRSRTPMAKWRNLRCRAVRSVRDTFLDQ
ncbi:uncharacterized protein [Struthio camelus]|uniref:uncharacterized protein isoform X1 n=1 Tax=Struthio camelus TaxID=8801 RepID=UPI003603B35A